MIHFTEPQQQCDFKIKDVAIVAIMFLCFHITNINTENLFVKGYLCSLKYFKAFFVC